MTRGRKKDHTIPPSRALTHQRDYRARKAQYVADLEERCHAAEDESRRLRLELERVKLARLSSASIYSPQAAQALSSLLQHLSAASSALEHFQKLAFSDQHRRHEYSTTPPLDSTPFRPPHHEPEDSRQDKQSLAIQPSATSARGSEEACESPRSPSLGSNCCDGWMNCTNLVDRDEEDYSPETSHGHSSNTMISDIRSTFDRVQ